MYLGLVLPLLACGDARSPGVGGADASTHVSKVRVHVISRDLSRAIGERGYAQMIESLASVDRLEANPRTKQRVEAIAKRLVRQAVIAFPFSQDWAWELHVVKDDEVNAHCFPGGKMTLNTGLLGLARFDEHKVATVLGHEIAHALLEHGRSSIGRSAVTLGTIRVMAQSFKMGQVRLNTLADGMQTVALPLEREQEREADFLGMHLMARAGFNPVRGAGIWADMQGDGEAPRLAQRLEAYLSSHPSSSERLATLTEIAQSLVAAPAVPRR